jgi:flagellar basal body rod protein FlgF
LNNLVFKSSIGFEDKIDQLREKAVNIEENCLRSDKSFREKILDMEKKNLKWENTVLDYKKETRKPVN